MLINNIKKNEDKIFEQDEFSKFNKFNETIQRYLT